MSLGTSSNVSKEEFITAMRSRLEGISDPNVKRDGSQCD